MIGTPNVPNSETMMVEIMSEAKKKMEILEKYPEAQMNGAGEVALRCVKEGRYLIVDCPSGKEYVAITQVGICLVWVDPQDVDFIMANKKLGCCGKRERAYYLANEAAVRQWTNRGGR